MSDDEYEVCPDCDGRVEWDCEEMGGEVGFLQWWKCLDCGQVIDPNDLDIEE